VILRNRKFLRQCDIAIKQPIISPFVQPTAINITEPTTVDINEPEPDVVDQPTQNVTVTKQKQPYALRNLSSYNNPGKNEQVPLLKRRDNSS